VAVLQEVGAWLEKYGESIYGTRGGPFKNGAWGGSTQRGSTVYLHIKRWEDGKVTLPKLSPVIKRSAMLTGGRVEVKQMADKIVVAMAAGQAQSSHCIVKLELDGPVIMNVPSDGK
jgi:alpha-L-fucosidase